MTGNLPLGSKIVEVHLEKCSPVVKKVSLVSDRSNYDDETHLYKNNTDNDAAKGIGLEIRTSGLNDPTVFDRVVSPDAEYPPEIAIIPESGNTTIYFEVSLKQQKRHSFKDGTFWSRVPIILRVY